MELKDIASVSGKGGLFRVLKPTRTGVILEALDENRSKLIAGVNHRVSLLKEISIYTNTKESSKALEDVLIDIKKKYGSDLPVNSKSEPTQLKEFLGSVLPEYDEEKVYASDIKKLVMWYDILNKFAPEVLEEKAQEETKPAEKKAAEPATEASSSEAKAEADAKGATPAEAAGEKSKPKAKATKEAEGKKSDTPKKKASPKQ